MLERFSVISNLAVTILRTVDIPEGASLNLKKFPSLQVDLNTTLSLQNGIFFAIVCVSNMLSSQEKLYLCRATSTDCSLATVKLNLILTNNLSKKFLHII